MSLSYSLFKNKLRKTIVDALYNEVISKTARYYHWLGKENSWSDFLSPFIPSSSSDLPGPPQNNFRYDLHVRRDILTAKSISSSDVSYVVPRIDWKFGEVYDMYDDAYTEPIETAILWAAGLSVNSDDIIKVGSIYYRAVNTGNLGNQAPTHVTGVVINGNVQLAYFTRDEFAYSGATSLEESLFYVLTSEFNVYKCISNNNNVPSVNMPTSTSTDIITTPDGYKWKFMFTIPIAQRNKFLSNVWMPVTTALKSQFYSNGAIEQIVIDTPGTGYLTEDPVVVTGDGYIAENPYIITNIFIQDAGLGYTDDPIVVISDPLIASDLAETATAESSVEDGSVTELTLLTTGYGYNIVPYPSITVQDPIVSDLVWSQSISVDLGDIVEYNITAQDEAGREYTTTVFYEVTEAGTTSEEPPTHLTGVEENGTAELTVVARTAAALAVLIKSEAQLQLIVEDGQIVGVEILDGGIGYTNANIEIVSNTGTGAILTPNFGIGNIDSLQANVELFAIPGSIEVIKVVDAGSGYGSATITILGDGVGATAIPIISSGQLFGVEITNAGSGYTWTDVVITGNGTGATARAIMSPINGHGSNAIDELNANSLMFYSSISRDRNQGIEIKNDYRKVGLIKNLKEFGTGNRFTKEFGSGCVLITADFDPTKIQYDMLLTKDEYKNYRVVDFTDNQILVSVFNNFTLNAGDTLITEQGYSFVVSDVVERTIDQFSGDLLLISVREPFEPTAEQIITLRTVITI